MLAGHSGNGFQKSNIAHHAGCLIFGDFLNSFSKRLHSPQESGVCMFVCVGLDALGCDMFLIDGSSHVSN